MLESMRKLLSTLKNKFNTWYENRLIKKLSNIDKAEKEMVDYIVEVEHEMEVANFTPRQVLKIHLPMLTLKAKGIGMALRWYWGATADAIVEEKGKESLKKVLAQAEKELGRPLNKEFRF